ncbi:TetR/AcrR family transcriptional regulator [Candidatus Pantoea formicae]|jgi:TetR/AcrR family transcriptional regulator, copper-responsive repressor|uniref:TetR/AcrR family transcriptional regulator n=1 Tax=Candidatus Pantoea formicae TaxID=2608355 RepID=A0ABX0QUC1_9GAMM|nr:TetR/AcrR family transcriptional regulator [Pantoea formicae]MDF7652069.1 TetR/AcrR family transcriptional regulator [Erwiniaceae bacterium L1_54_3]NIF00470.1 TetR/AcrR family transcriptional regulator [Pantoea formicae]
MTEVTDTLSRKSRGRPKVFDREDALDKALMLFWAHGYEGTSLSDLVEATGAKAPTLYAEFENKEGLFRAAMQRYIETFSAQRNAVLDDESRDVKSAIEAYFRATAACFTECDKPAGCFFICTSSALSSGSEEIAHMLAQQHHAQERALKQFLELRQQRGELPQCADSATLASFLACLLQGMSVRAREGATRDDLDGIVNTQMAIWPALAGYCELNKD